MKLVKTASGKNKIKMSRSEWTNLGKKAGWINKKANYSFDRTPEETARSIIENQGTGHGMELWEAIDQFTSAANGEDHDGMKRLYPKYTTEDFLECARLLTYHEKMSNYYSSTYEY